MNEKNKRSAMLYGEHYEDILKNKKVVIFGIGGVGGFVAEGLARIGIGHLVLVDHDQVSESNLNRQIIALHSTIGMDKVEVMKNRIHDINPEIKVDTYCEFYLNDKQMEYLYEDASYVVDAIDTVTAKLDLICKCAALKIPIISSMGTGNKKRPDRLEISDVFKTTVDPLARVMRRELKKRGIKKCKVVYSKEEPTPPCLIEVNENNKVAPGSSPFVPSSAGLLIASEVVKDLLNS